MNYKELFIDKDDILLIRKELVRVLGDLNEAVILNQLNYWIEINKKADKNFYDDRYWVFNTYQTWKETDFDFWSTDTIRRTLTRLENKGIVLTANYNKLKLDKTKWYTIDYKKLQERIDKYVEKQNAIKDNADCGHDMANCIDGNGSISKAIPENTSKITRRDYGSDTSLADTSKQKDVLKPQADTPIPKKHLPERVPKKKTRSELKELESDMIDRFSAITSQYELSDTCYRNTVKAFKHYLDKYTERTNKVHPILSDNTLEKIFETLAMVNDTEYGHFEKLSEIEPGENENSYLDALIDEHFRSKHEQGTDWHISHFASVEYLEKMAQHVVDW